MRRCLDAPALSDALLRAWGPDPTRREIHDTKVPGLIARGEPSGNPTFWVRRMIAGKRERRFLRRSPEITLKAVRLPAMSAGPEPAPSPTGRRSHRRHPARGVGGGQGPGVVGAARPRGRPDRQAGDRARARGNGRSGKPRGPTGST
jgi:hypothetical protein